MVKASLILCLCTTAYADPKPEPPKPPAEVAELAKLLTGTWKCDGTIKLPDGDQKFKVTIVTRADVNGFWVHESMSGTLNGATVKMEAYMTSDAGKWRRIAIDSFGGQTLGTSDGLTDKKMDWALESNTGEREKAHFDASDLKKGLHVWSERSVDKGKNWSDGPDLICKK